MTLSHSLGVLAGRLPAAEGAGVAGPATRDLVTRMARPQEVKPPAGEGQIKEMFYQAGLAQGIRHLAARLPPAEAADIARTTARRLAKCMIVVEQAVVEQSAALNALTDGLGAPAGLLPPTEAAATTRPAARLLASRMASSAGKVFLHNHAQSLATLAVYHDDDALVCLPKSHGGFWAVREGFLSALERRSGRIQTPAPAAALGWAAMVANDSPPFADVWEFADWAEKHRPDLDLASRPAVK